MAMQQTYGTPGAPAGEKRDWVRLHPGTDVGSVTLTVADLARSLAFYRDTIGLALLEDGRDGAWLGAGDRRILRLAEKAGAQPAPRRATGLYHAAILFPDRRSLAIKVAQLARAGLPVGQGDHLVSEAFYLSDPDGNGLELYRDRPRAEWQWNGSEVRMASDPVDMQSLLGEIRGEPDLAEPAAPAGTRLGHVHLKVNDIAQAEAFYHGVLGFDVTARWPGALFVSAGGYHHHLGLNTWESRGAGPAGEGHAGLREFSLTLPDETERDRLATRVEAAGGTVDREAGSSVITDPSGNRIRLIARD